MKGMYDRMDNSIKDRIECFDSNFPCGKNGNQICMELAKIISIISTWII
jgi:hypothetical protein